MNYMKRFKFAFLTAFSHLSRLILNLFIIKEIALSQGPEGLGLLGNYMNLVTIASNLAGGGITTGIIKYISEYKSSIYRQLDFAGSALIYTIITCLMTLVLGLLCVGPITKFVFLTQPFHFYIILFFISQIFAGFNNFTYGLLNGYQKTSHYAFLMIAGNIIGFLFAYYAIKNLGVMGAILSILSPILGPSVATLMYSLLNRYIVFIRFSRVYEDSLKLSQYSAMLIFSTICFPLVEMYVRNKIIIDLGINEAGIWQAINKLSTAYLSFYIYFLSFYLIPIISAERNLEKIYQEVVKMIGFISFIFLMMVIVYQFLSDSIILFIFSKDFLGIRHLFLLQLLGDYFRVITWVVGFIVIAKAFTKTYIIGELLQGLLFITLSIVELHYFKHLKGVLYAYVGTCILYSILCFSLFFYFFKINKTQFVRCLL